MPVVKAVESIFSASRKHTPPPSDTWESDTARCATRWGRSGAFIRVDGEIDATNAAPLADYAQDCADYCQWLIVDLHDLEFIGTAGFTALNTIVDNCADAKIHCAIVTGAALERLLRICDPDGILPIAVSVAEALTDVPAFRQAR